MAETSLDVLRAHMGVFDGPSLVAAVQAASDDTVDRLSENLLARPPETSRSIPATEVWPLVNARTSLLSRGVQGLVDGRGPSGISIFAAMSPREIGSTTFSSGVLRALLYSHGLVVEDPLLLAAELHTTSPQRTRSMSRQFVEAAVVSLCEVDSLIDTRILETFFVGMDARSSDSPSEERIADALASSDRDELWDAFESGYIDGLAPALRELWQRIRAGDRNPPLNLVEEALTQSDVDVVRTFVDVVSSLRPHAVIDNSFAIVSSLIDDQQRLGGRHDLFCVSPLFARLLFAGNPDPVAELRVSQLARTPVPNISDLGLRDVVAMRQQSEAFALWRTRLSAGLEQAHDLRDRLGDSVDLAQVVDDVLAEARAGLQRETARSAVLSRAGVISYVAGILGGVASGIGSGASEIVHGALGGLAGAAAQHGLNRGEQVNPAVLRHYVMFERAT